MSLARKDCATVWVVDPYRDTVREIPTAKWDAYVGDCDKWGTSLQSRDRVFATRAEACAYILKRAKGNLEAAYMEVKATKARLARCQKKFGGTQ